MKNKKNMLGNMYMDDEHSFFTAYLFTKSKKYVSLLSQVKQIGYPKNTTLIK